MKKLTLFFMLIVCFIQANSQTCTTVKELNRKRHKIEGSTYGHPYTTFDRHNGLTFQETIKNIRKNITSVQDVLNQGKKKWSWSGKIPVCLDR